MRSSASRTHVALAALLLLSALPIRAFAEDPPAATTREYRYDTSLVRAAAQASWPKLGRSYFWNWFRCDSTRIFVPGEVAEAEDPLATVCFEARDLTQTVQPVQLRIERTGVGRTRLSIAPTERAGASAVRNYLKTLDKTIAKAQKSNSPIHSSYFRALPSTLLPRAREALGRASEDCARRAVWLETADPLDAATQRAIEARIASGIESCAAAIAAHRLKDHPVDSVVRQVRGAGDATVAAANARSDSAAIRATIARLEAYPKPIREALAVETAAWVVTATALEVDAANKITQARANLAPELKACYALRERARVSGADLAMAVHAPLATSGQAAMWLVPGPLLHTNAGEGFARVEDGQGGVSWAVSLPFGYTSGTNAHVIGLLTTITVTTGKGAQLVPLLRGDCYSEELPQ